MSLRFVIGRPGSGKTHWCLEQARAAARAQPDGPPIIFLVPEQASYMTEAELFTREFRGTARVRVFSFQRLAQWVFSQGPREARPRLTDAHRRVLVTAILTRLRRDTKTGALLRIRHIEDSVAAILAELKQFRVNRDDLAALALEAAKAGHSQLAEKLGQLLAVADEYDLAVRSRFEDPEDSLAGLSSTLQKLDLLQGAQLFLDGFFGFTPVEEEVLRGLLPRCAAANIILPIDPMRYKAVNAGAMPDPLSPFFPIEETLARLLGLLADTGLAVEAPVVLPRENPSRFEAPELAHLEKHFLEEDSVAVAPQPGGAIRMLAAADRRDEARAAVEQILEWRRNHGWSWGRMAILSRNLDDCASLLAEFLRSARVPYFLDRHEPLETHPIIQGTLAALEATWDAGWHADSLLAFARSQLMDFDADGVARLEEFVTSYPRSREQWFSPDPWTHPPRRSPFEEDERPLHDAARQSLSQIDLTRRALIAALRPLADNLRAAHQPEGVDVSSAAAAICKFLATTAAAARTEDEPILEQVGQLLEAVIQSAGTAPMDSETLHELLVELLGALRLPRIPPLLDQVLVGQVDRSRQPPLLGVVVIGLAEGTFPPPGSNNSLLTDAERETIAQLGARIELRASSRVLFQREAFFALQAFTRASNALTLVRPLSTDSGHVAPPSPWWVEVRRILPGIEEHQLAPGLSPQRILRAREAAAWICQSVFGTTDRGVVPPAFDERSLLANLPPEQTQEFHHVVGFSRRRNEARLSPATAAAMMGSAIRTSVSALESHARCPFQYFMGWMIRPEVSPAPQLTRADVGNLAHAALKELAQALEKQGRSFAELVPAEIPSLVAASFAGPEQRLAASGVFGTNASRVVARLLRGQLVELAVFLADASRAMKARTLFTEVPFGRNRPLKPLVITLDNNVQVFLEGQIDRIDVASGSREWIVVFDYKLSGRQQQWAKAAAGLSLQLPVYLLVAGENSASVAGGGVPAAALYIGILERQDKERVLRGIYSKSFDEDLGLSERRFLKPSDGAEEATSKYGDALSAAQFQRLGDAARTHIIHHVQSILSGVVSVSPFRLGNESPCGYCDYRAACRLDYSMNNRRIIPALDRQQAIESLLGPARGAQP